MCGCDRHNFMKPDVLVDAHYFLLFIVFEGNVLFLFFVLSDGMRRFFS